MKTFNRICIEDHTITDREGTSFTLRRAKEYTTSGERDGSVLVFSQYWVRAPIGIFAGAIPGLGSPHTRCAAEGQ